MNPSCENEVFSLLGKARWLGHTPEAVALAEQAVALADSHDDVEVGYRARQELMDVASHSGDYDKLLMAFSWCLAEADRQPEKHSVWELLWKYKWVIEHLVHFPRISRAQIHSALADFQKRSLQAGFNERPALFLRWVLEIQMGDLPAAEPVWNQWKLTQRDALADCEACEINRVAEFFAVTGEHAAALKAATPILSGRKKCAEIPHLTYATLLQSFGEVQGPEVAAQMHEKGYRLVRGNRDFIREQAWHVRHLVRAGELDEAMTLVRRHLPWALETRNPDYQFYFLVATRTVLRQLQAKGRKSARLRLAREVFPAARKTTVPIEPFAGWLTEKINRLAMDFDTRNGNHWFAQLAREDHPG